MLDINQFVDIRETNRRNRLENSDYESAAETTEEDSNTDELDEEGNLLGFVVSDSEPEYQEKRTKRRKSQPGGTQVPIYNDVMSALEKMTNDKTTDSQQHPPSKAKDKPRRSARLNPVDSNSKENQQLSAILSQFAAEQSSSPLPIRPGNSNGGRKHEKDTEGRPPKKVPTATIAKSSDLNVLVGEHRNRETVATDVAEPERPHSPRNRLPKKAKWSGLFRGSNRIKKSKSSLSQRTEVQRKLRSVLLRSATLANQQPKAAKPQSKRGQATVQQSSNNIASSSVEERRTDCPSVAERKRRAEEEKLLCCKEVRLPHIRTHILFSC